MRRLIALATAAGMILLGMIAVPGPAHAKVAGPNGRIAFVRFDPAGDSVLEITEGVKHLQHGDAPALAAAKIFSRASATLADAT